MPKIQFTTPEGATFDFDLTAPSSTVGRAPENDLVVPDGSVSSRHGKINLKGESIEIEDLGSTNGTHVGGERVQQADIAPGGTFRLGNVQAVLLAPASAAAPEPEETEPSAESFSEQAADEPQEEEQSSAPTWSPPLSSSSGAVISGLGASPCPANQRRGFGPKPKAKNSGGSALMGVAGLALAVCAAAVFFILKMSA